MPTIQYPNHPNTDTAFVVQDDGTKNRALMTAPQDTSTLELPKNANSCKGYVTINGKKQRVVMTADVMGGGSGGTYTAGTGISITNNEISATDPVLMNKTTANNSLQILGTGTTDINCVCVGENTRSKQSNCVAIGNNSFIDGNTGLGSSVALGGNAQIYGKNQTFIGAFTSDTYNSNAQYCIGIGALACTSGAVKGAIQIGKGTNSESGTLYVGQTTDGTNFTNTKLLDSDGTIPEARLADTTNAQQGDVLTLDANGDAVWQAGGSGGGLPSQTGNAGKFLTTDGTDASWSDKPLVNAATGSRTIAIGGIGTIASIYSISLGTNAGPTGNFSVSLGDSSESAGGGAIAIGYAAKTSAAGAIQLNTSVAATTNSDADTFKVANRNGNFEIMSANGTIPAARHAALPSVDGTYVLKLVIANGVPTLSWVAE